MKLHETLFGRLLAQVMVYALVQASIPPAWAVSLEAPRSLAESPRQQAKPTAFETYAAELASVNPDWEKLQRLAQSFPVVEKPAVSRLLAATEMESRKGMLAVNPYVAGSQKWSVNYAGIDLLTGNYSTSATDLSFEGGYGIPINVTRTYSSNNPDDGPLGRGWTLSVDVRTTAGGILKGKGSPDRSVPVQMFDRPQNEPARGADEVTLPSTILTEGVIAKDAGGFEEDIMRDVDGILTTPPWDSNVYGGALEFDEVSGKEFWLNTSLVMTTPEGTVYEYSEHGSYQSGGAKSAFDESSTPTRTPSNILKIDRITDRHGNETEFTYTGTATYGRATGTVTEGKLSSILMPGDRALVFTYDTNGHLTRAADGTTSDARCVDYAYTENRLTSVETGITVGSQADPLVTTYDYGDASEPDGWTPETAGELLTSITDPRGLTTEIYYFMGATRMLPYTSWGVPAPHCYAVKSPNGVYAIAQAYETNGAKLFGSTVPTSHGTGHDDVVFGQYLRSGSSWVELSKGQLFLTAPDGDINDPFELEMHDMRAANSGGTQNPVVWEREYNINLGQLTSETSYIHPKPDEENSLRIERGFDHGNFAVQKAVSTMTYNFLGAPLTKQTVFSLDDGGGYAEVSRSEVGYAYHGPEKYFQQKAMRAKVGSSTWRYSYTDYYENDEYTGGAARGMTKFVYDPKYGGITCTDEDEADWRTNIAPTSDQHSAKFEYDSEGRIVEVQKLQTVTSGPTYNRVKTTTSYNSDGSPGWGLPYQVIEDQGSGKINRTTETTEYDRAGRATVVEDAAGRVFETAYNARGQVELVTRTDTSPDIPIVQYWYGMDDGLATNGMVTDVYDCLSGAVTWVAYFASDHSTPSLRGQVDNVYNDDGLLWGDYTVYYDYDAAGRRAGVSYEFLWHLTGGSTTYTNYAYSDYLSVGSPESPSYVFQTMTLLSGSSPTAEEFHYRFDTAGRMLESAFAQTPQGGAPYYASPAERRALAVYEYRPAGELAEVRYHWQDWDDTEYVTTNIGKVAYAYDDYKGLRESATFTSGDGSGWGTSRTENYTYEADLDYLTGVDYNDGLANEVQTWTYDAAGNRSNSGYTYDNLNRMTASPGSTTYDYDDDPIGLLGFRLWRNPESATTTRYSWDDAGRMTQVASNTAGANYMYRADGMRIKKVTGLSIAWQPPEGEVGGFYNEEQADDNPTWRYRYDGQMCFEEDFTRGDPVVVTGTSYALGARGIDMMRTFSVNTGNYNRSYTGTFFPIYDGHGNMIATLVRDGSGWDLTNERSYDVWGGVRGSNDDGDPNARYCANLGHKQDDESGLVYMRARYYEPGTGRFVSEDPARDGGNWFTYCDNEPINNVDQDGKVKTNLVLRGIVFGTALWFIVNFVTAMASGEDLTNVLKKSAVVVIEAVLFGAVGPIHERLYPVTYKVASQLTNALNDPRFEQGTRFRRVDVIIAFYAGYQLFLAWAMDMLDDWARN
ncbi:MAG: hypothetical protein K1X67_19525 [Fimbriimonadaceae bacterium]|nr:hypothetical protein [Fimbriimonadaceae bacterium]